MIIALTYHSNNGFLIERLCFFAKQRTYFDLRKISEKLVKNLRSVYCLNQWFCFVKII